MRIIKFIFGCSLILLFPIFFLQASAEKGYLEAKDYITASSDETNEISSFLQTCKKQGKDAFFNEGIYKINGIVILQDGVSLLGEEGAILQGTDEENQSYLKDDGKVVSITIENFIFDNVAINFSHANSDKITIQNNVFLNAKFADLNIGGIKPDSSNKNGGKNTGYYVSKSHNQITILSNIFLRDKNSLGRGVSIYKTQNAIIQDNYFGLLEDVENSIVSDQTKALKRRVLESGLVNTASDQGYFMTAINVVNSDENAQIIGNHISVNKDITEAGYEDGSQSTNGYNRDHIIYAKMYKGLTIVGNYFKGMNKNQDGGVKCRNGEDLLIYKNVFEDSLILLYVQNATTNQWLKNVYVKENIFLNKDYTNELIQIPSGSNILRKYITIDYSILLKNYMATAEVNNITIDSNVMYSAGLPNEQIRIDNTQFAMPTNVTIQNNTNILGRQMRLTIMNTLNSQNYDSNQQGTSPDYTNGTTYSPEIPSEYQTVSVEKLVDKNEVDYEIQNGKFVSSADQMYVDGKVYQNEELEEDKVYQILLIKASTTDICLEGVKKTIPTNLYTIATITKNQTYRINFQIQGHGQEIDEISASSLPEPLPDLEAVGYTFDGWYLDLGYMQRAIPGEKITQDTTLYAKWIQNRYTITYVTEYGEQLDSIAEALRLPTSFPMLTAEGYIFDGWFLNETYTQAATEGAPITADTVLYAKWTEQLEVTFQNNQQPIIIFVRKGSTIEEPVTPTKSGYVFDGWYLDSACTKAYDFDQPVIESMSLYAKWILCTYMVTYSTQGHGSAIASTKGISCLPDPLPIPEETGWEFQGWYLDDAYQEKAIDGAAITTDTTLYAKWEKIPKYTITLQVAGEGMLAQFTLYKGKKIPKPADPVKEDYSFDGWYIDSACTMQWNFDTSIEGDVVLYAKWISTKEPSTPQSPSEPEKTSNTLWIILSVAGAAIIGMGLVMLVVHKKKKK